MKGYPSYTFSSSSGVAKVSGSLSASVPAGSSGTVYLPDNNGIAVERYTVTRTSATTSSYVYDKSVANGPYISNTYTYAVGDEIGEPILVETGTVPEGKTQVGTVSSGGVSYIICSEGSGYVAYCADGSDTKEYYRREFSWYGYPLEISYDKAVWTLYETYSQPNTASDTEVKAIWSGYVAGREVLCAVCNGNLWELTLENGAWSKVSCGYVNTSGSVFMFGFEGKLYVLNGTQYLVWDGETMTGVEGYRPLVSVSNVPSGGGTLLESVNKLTGARRAWFSPDGTSTVFTLPEKGIVSLDWVKDTSTGAAMSGWSANLAEGTVTFSTAPTAGTNTMEIAWTVSDTDHGSRHEVRGAI